MKRDERDQKGGYFFRPISKGDLLEGQVEGEESSNVPLGEMFPGIDENDSFRRFCLTGHRILSDTFRNGVSICISRLQLGIAREGSTKKFFGAMLLKENKRDDKMIRIRLFVDLITVMMNVYLCLFVSMCLELISLLRFMS